MANLIIFTTKELGKPWDIWKCILVPLGYVHCHLRHPHSWVWLTAAQIFGLLFASCQPEELTRKWKSKTTKKKLSEPVAVRFLTNDLEQKVRFLKIFSFVICMRCSFWFIIMGLALGRNSYSWLVARVILKVCWELERVNLKARVFQR